MATIFIVSFFALKQIKSSTAQQQQDNLQTLLLTVQQAHHILVEQRLFALENIAENSAIVKLTQHQLQRYRNGQDIIDSPELIKLRKIIGPIIDNFGDQGFFIIAPDNISIGSMRNINIGKTNLIAEQKPALLLRAFSGENIFVPPIRSDVPLFNHKRQGSSGDATMFIVSPIIDKEDQVIATIALRINPMRYFSTVTALGRVGESGETYAFDKTGALLTESRFVNQLRKLNLLDYGENSTFNIYLRDPGGNLLKGHKINQPYNELPFTFMAQQALNGKSGTHGEGYRDYRGIEVIGAWIWDQQFEFGITSEINIEEALLPYYQTRNTFVAVITITLLLLILLLRSLFAIQRQHQLKTVQINEKLELRVHERTQDLEHAKEALSQVNQELQVLAITDGLTGLFNRRHFDNQLNMEWQRCLRDKKNIAIILFDIDFFKQYNDFYGHLMGDICLKNIGTSLLDSNLTKRPSDIIARYGGEEFIVLLSNTTAEYCAQAAQTICDNIRELCIPHERSISGENDVVTVSVGYIVTGKITELRPNQLINRADKALYQAKRNGRNRVVEFSKENNNNITSLREVKNDKRS